MSQLILVVRSKLLDLDVYYVVNCDGITWKMREFIEKKEMFNPSFHVNLALSWSN